MYGTVARLRLMPGKEADLLAEMKAYDELKVDGAIASALYRADAGGEEYWMAVVFESKEKYRANADSPEQDQRFQKLRALLAADPEWHDGEVLARNTAG